MKTLYIKNIRSIKDLQVDIDKPITIIAGANGTGKTTVLETIERSLMLKGFDKSAITKGQEEGESLYVNSLPDGTRQEVHMTINNDKTSVVMRTVDNTGKERTVKEVNEARRILGNYVNFTPQDIINMTQTAEGRKKFLLDVLFKSMDNETKARLSLLENQISSRKNINTTNNLYQKRSAVSAEVKNMESLMNKFQSLSDEEERMLESYDVAVSKRKKLVANLSRLSLEAQVYKSTESFIKSNRNMFEEIPKWFVDIEMILANVEIGEAEILSIQESIEKADKFLKDIDVLKQRKQSSHDIQESLKIARDKYATLDKEIGAIKDEISAIYQKADLPGGLTIETNEDEEIDFLIDNAKGNKVSLHQLSESQLHYFIITLLMHISTSEMVNIGNISIYDQQTLNKILELASKYDRILLAEQVTESEDLQIILI